MTSSSRREEGLALEVFGAGRCPVVGAWYWAAGTGAAAGRLPGAPGWGQAPGQGLGALGS